MLGGGNAIDAAVAAAAVLAVTEPYQTGLGGDAFALIYQAATGRTHALNASGPAPVAARVEAYRAKGWTGIPQHDPWSWTVPGCVDGFSQMLARFGTRSLRDALQPAVSYAETGFSVSPADAASWATYEAVLRADPGCSTCLLIDGALPRAGDVLMQPRLAATMRLIAEGGRDAFYTGPIASDVVRFSQAFGGLLSQDDLASFKAEWQAPIALTYRGRQVLECPPNGQGLAALLALRAAEALPFDMMERNSAACLHGLIEATKYGMTRAAALVADPRHSEIGVEAALAATPPTLVVTASDPEKAPPPPSDTVFLAVADAAGNAVALITSVYGDFGSGFCVPERGFILQNRGSGFSLDPDHPNCLAPGKRPYHTIIPGLALRDGVPELVFGMTGGFLQPQGHLQLLVSLFDYGLDVQSTIDLPRFSWEGGRRVVLEDGFPPETYSGLAARGHEVVRRSGHRGFGGAQIISIDHSRGVMIAGSEPRHDGAAMGY